MIRRFSSPPTCLFVQSTLSTCRYLVVRESSASPIFVAAGSFPCEDVETLADRVREDLKQKDVHVTRAVLLLSRGNLEMNSLQLPPATEDELPDLVANMVAQYIDDAEGSFVHDFVVGHEAADQSRDVLTFSLNQSALTEWRQRFKAQQMRLVGVTFGAIGAVHLLNKVSRHPARTSVVVTTTDQDTDIAVVEDRGPVLFRTIPRATGGQGFEIEQLAGDIQRTLTLVGHPEVEATRVYLIGAVDDQQDVAQLLSEELSLSVSLVSPFDQLNGKVSVDQPSLFANLIGTACAWNQNSLAVDMLNPRRPRSKPSVKGRFIFWSAIAASVLAMAGYLAWDHNAQQSVELADRQVELQRLVKRAKQSDAKQKRLAVLDAWAADNISWLDELRAISLRLPPADQATVGSLSMSSSPSGRGRIEMAVEVNEPSVRMELEKAIRDERHTITSKRLMDASDRSNSVWRFQTVVGVVPQPRATPAANEPNLAEANRKAGGDR